MAAALGDHACAGGNLDASYTVSFGRIRVGEITATIVLGDREYAISARGRAGGLMKALVDGEGSFSARGTITANHPVPTKFSSNIVSNAEASEVTMVSSDHANDGSFNGSDNNCELDQRGHDHRSRLRQQPLGAGSKYDHSGRCGRSIDVRGCGNVHRGYSSCYSVPPRTGRKRNQSWLQSPSV